MARTKTTSNPPPQINYKALYPWAFEDEAAHMIRLFGGKCDAYITVCPCAEGEPVCVDDRVNYGEPFFFLYATIFKRIKLRLPLTGFEQALLTEINVAPTQLHSNGWAFVRAFTILCNHLGFTPSVDVFLYFFEAKSPGKKLWVSFNGVVGRSLLTLFQQFYKGFKGKFFKVCCTAHDPTLLDGFPLYWVGELKFKRPRGLEDLIPPDRELC